MWSILPLFLFSNISSKTLFFKRDEIEALRDEDYFQVHVTNDNSSYKMTKKENDVTKTFNIVRNLAPSKFFKAILINIIF